MVIVKYVLIFLTDSQLGYITFEPRGDTYKYYGFIGCIHIQGN